MGYKMGCAAAGAAAGCIPVRERFRQVVYWIAGPGFARYTKLRLPVYLYIR